MALILVRMLNADHQAFPLTTIAFPVGITMTHLHYRFLHQPLLPKNQQTFNLRLRPLSMTSTWIPSNLMQCHDHA